MSLLNNYISKKTPLVSIIIINYNGLSYIDRCLCSILDQEYPDYEINKWLIVRFVQEVK